MQHDAPTLCSTDNVQNAAMLSAAAVESPSLPSPSRPSPSHDLSVHSPPPLTEQRHRLESVAASIASLKDVLIAANRPFWRFRPAHVPGVPVCEIHKVALAPSSALPNSVGADLAPISESSDNSGLAKLPDSDLPAIADVSVASDTTSALTMPTMATSNLATSTLTTSTLITSTMPTSTMPTPATDASATALANHAATDNMMSLDVDASQLNNTSDAVEHETELERILSRSDIELYDLRRACWNGIADHLRPAVWQLLLGYLPVSADRRAATLKRKRQEYRDIIAQHYGNGQVAPTFAAIHHQISIDVPRTCPGIALFQNEAVRKSILRILYCWSVRRPAIGYVQGINDLVTPFYDVFMSQYLPRPAGPGAAQSPKEEESKHVLVSEEVMLNIEADCFWCLSKLLDSIQLNYTFNQIGISQQISRMRKLVERTDARLVSHLDGENVQFVQFAFRWMNCMLMREFPLHIIVRMWDTYMAEGEDGFSDFHIYVCAAFLLQWSAHLKLLDFENIMMFLQTPPTAGWTSADVELLLSEAYAWKSLDQRGQQDTGANDGSNRADPPAT